MFLTLATLCMPLSINDPFFPKQFPLKNTGQFFGIANEDIHVTQVWEDGVFGRDIAVNIIGNGCVVHDDILDGFDNENSWNYLTNENDPMPDLNETVPGHGTYMAGVVGARMNDMCSVGVAPLCRISCTNLFNKGYSKENFLDALKRNNGKIKIKLISKTVILNGEFEDDDAELNKILDEAPDDVNFVVGTGNSKHFADTNSWTFLRHPRVIVVSDINNRGASSAWANSGANILTNAPAGGSSSFLNDFYPSMPGLGIANKSECIDGFNPQGTGAAIVAGSIALILEINPNLKWRDIQALIAETSSHNDPNHYSWIKNNATNGLIHSNLYGFGRINLNSLKFSAKNWINFPPQFSEKFYNSVQKNIPTMRRGKLDYQFHVQSNIKFIETVQLSINLSAYNISLIRISLTSPLNTLSFVKSYSTYENEKFNNVYHFTIRSYFGEDPNGKWTISLISDSINDNPILHSIELKVNGCKEEPNVYSANPEKGNNPYQKPTTKNAINASIPNEVVSCGEEFDLNLNSNDNITVSLYLSDEQRKSRWPIGYDRNTQSSTKLIIPCFFKGNKTMHLIAENKYLDSYGETSLKILNGNQNYFLYSPNRYQVFKLDPITNDIEFDVIPSFSSEYWIDGQNAQNIYISLYDIDNKTIIYEDYQPLFKQNRIHYNGRKCVHCLISVVPKWAKFMDPCINMIQPISIINPLDLNPDQFPIDLNNICPIPPGVLTPTPVPIPTQTEIIPSSNSAQSVISIVVGALFLFSFSLFVILFFYMNRRRDEAIYICV